MISYLLLFALVGLVALGVLRAKRHRPSRRAVPHREPYVTETGPSPEANMIEDEILAIRAVHAEDDAEDALIEEEVVLLASHTAAPEKIPEVPVPTREQPYVRPQAPATRTFVASQQKMSTLPFQKPATKPIIYRPIEMSDFIVLNLFAEEGRPYRGYELLQALLTAGFRYGKRSVFHRFEDLTGRGEVLFSLASAVEPGVFDLPKIGSFSTPGLTLYMQISGLNHPAQAFELLLNAATELTEALGGEIYDEERQVLSEERVYQWRACLHEKSPLPLEEA